MEWIPNGASKWGRGLIWYDIPAFRQINNNIRFCLFGPIRNNIRFSLSGPVSNNIRFCLSGRISNTIRFCLFGPVSGLREFYLSGPVSYNRHIWIKEHYLSHLFLWSPCTIAFPSVSPTTALFLKFSNAEMNVAVQFYLHTKPTYG